MKKIISIIIIIVLSIKLFSISNDFQTAKKISDNFIQSKDQNLKFSHTITVEQNNTNLFYIFNYEPSSFVAVSADNDIFPIIAYSFKNNISHNESYLTEIISNDISLRMDYYKKNPNLAKANHQKWEQYLNGNIISRDFQQWPAAGNTITDGWLETRWMQGGIYDNFCPLDNSGERSNVGCVATAMAQIVNFHRFIGNPLITFDDSDDYYAGGGIDIDDDHVARDFPSFPELNGYLLDLWNHYEFEVELSDEDKAALSFACGITVEMLYSSSGSSASTSAVGYTLRNKFDFDDAFYYSMSGSFYEQLQTDMIEMRPAQLSIYNSEQQIGHSIVCDGYNTDGYFHLNMGWGISNETSWYLLPSEIPDGYSIVSGGVLEIEGGDIPVNVLGNVIINGASAPGTYITLEGDLFYETYVTLFSGDFELPAVAEGFYTATAMLEEDRHYFQSYDIYIDANNNFLQFELGHFEGVSGTVTAPISPEGTNISFYQDGELINSGFADSNGDFFVSNILPGDYLSIAGLNGNYYEQQEITITLENQIVDFDLAEYPGNISLSYAGFPTETWNFVSNYTLTCAVKFTGDELQNLEDEMISKIRFKSPIDQEDGELFAQIWIGDYLISETEIADFSDGEWLEINVENFIPVNLNTDYFVGYKITSSTGEFVFHDDTPRIAGKGAFYRTTGWTELPAQNDYNFCIDAVLITQDFGSISGNIQLSGGNGDVTDVALKSGNYISHPEPNGDYQIDLLEGSYELSCTLQDYSSGSIESLEIQNGQILEEQDFILNYSTGIGEENIPDPGFYLEFFPNPFRVNTTVSFNISRKDAKNADIEIYNIKGQKIKSFSNLQIDETPNQQVIWDGKDDQNRKISSGIYFVRITAGEWNYQKRIVRY